MTIVRILALRSFLLLSIVLVAGSDPRTLAGLRAQDAAHAAREPADPTYVSHPPIRALPTPSDRPMDEGPAYFVDPNGSDANDGSKGHPWKTLRHAIARLRPGHTLYLREGIHWAYGQVNIGPENSGRPGAPVTIRSYPGELAVVDFGIREFFEDPASAWEPYTEGVPGEYRSTRTYLDPPLSRGLSGNFGDSMVPLFRYIFIEDLRSENEHARRGLPGQQHDPEGLYSGPGIFWDEATGRVHARLRHTTIEARGDANYRGETDPRKIPLIIARVGDAARFRIAGARHVRILDLVIRGSDRSTVAVARSTDIDLEGLWIYGGAPALSINGTNVRVLHSKIRGFDAPWHSRYHDKYRANAGYISMLAGTDLEIAYNEFTDNHDGIRFGMGDGVWAEDVEFHHNLVSNMNDDCLFLPTRRPTGVLQIYQNIVSGCGTALSHAGGGDRAVAAEGAGTYVYRNVFDLRRLPYKNPPFSDRPNRNEEGTYDSKLAGAHGDPSIWPATYFYHNTVTSWNGSEQGGAYALEMSTKTGATIRRVFNNIFIQTERKPGQRLPPPGHDFEASGNLFWGLRAGASGSHPGDVYADPQFIAFTDNWRDPTDFGLQARSPAIDAGVEIPASWPDPLRASDESAPDIGAFPFGVSAPMPADSVIRLSTRGAP
jgi:hypothetical protein